jgi:polyhydroxyalkanoate synthesis regulator phasin
VAAPAGEPVKSEKNADTAEADVLREEVSVLREQLRALEERLEKKREK